jgi:hypothetical protein
MTVLKCPHCFNDVPFGARVCAGCGAELHYGAPPKLLACAIIFAIFVVIYVTKTLNGGPVLGSIAALAVLGGLVALMRRAFRDRVRFVRRYRT